MRPHLALLPLLLAACTPSSPGEVRESRFMLGTIVEFVVVGTDEANAKKAIVAAAAEMERIEQLLTIYGDSDNPVKQFNASPPGTPITLPTEISRLLELGVAIQQKSDGAFHPALGAIDRLWGFSLPEPRTAPPTSGEIRAALPGGDCLQRKGNDWLRRSESCQLDFGAIGKGYALDRAMGVLRQHEIANALINGGGDIRLIGMHGERPWRIAIRHPRQSAQILGSVQLSGDAALFSSGDYERFFIHGGKRYHHLLDPATGAPATRAQSSTIVAEGGAVAFGWSTALFVMGEAGLATATGAGLAALLVTDKGEVRMNEAMRRHFHPTGEE